MPTYRSITISITSQFDICQLPEYAPPTSTEDPFTTLPSLLNPDLSLVTVYMPTYPSSQFWLRYSIAPPYPPRALYYFKLYLNEKCVVSWGCGEDDGYRGKTVFGLYDSGGSWGEQASIERRMMCFSGSENPNDVMEIKVYRAKGRQRISPELQHYKDVMPRYLTQENPQRFYKYALLDPLDKPFASFRYFPRTWDQLIALGVASPDPSRQSSPQNIPTKRPSRKSSNLTDSSAQSNSSSSSSSVNTHEETVTGTAKAVTLSPPSQARFLPRLSRSSSAQGSSPQKSADAAKPSLARQQLNRAVTAPSLISISPNPHSTVTQQAFASLVRRARTPSPRKQNVRNRVPTPSPTKDSSTRNLSRLPRPPSTPKLKVSESASPLNRATRSGSVSLLMNVVNSAVKRKTREVGKQHEDNRPRETLVLQAIQTECGDDALMGEVKSATAESPSTDIREPEGEEGKQVTEEDKGNMESPAPSLQRSKSESESDTSSKRAAKERKGFLKHNLLRKKVEAERSASSTPDAERENRRSCDTLSKKWRSRGTKGGDGKDIKAESGKE